MGPRSSNFFVTVIVKTKNGHRSNKMIFLRVHAVEDVAGSGASVRFSHRSTCSKT